MNLGQYVSRSAMYWGTREAVICAETRRSFAEVDTRTNQLASAMFGLGLEPGDAVATYASNCAELVEIEVAAYKAGLVRVPINARLSATEAAHVLGDSGTRLLFVDSARATAGLEQAIVAAGDGVDTYHLDRSDNSGRNYEDFVLNGSVEPLAVDVAEPAICVLHYTSGSTGHLKAAVQTVGNRRANLHKRLMTPGTVYGAADRYLVTGPITHASGMAVLACLSRGGAVVIMPQWSTETFLRLVCTEGITSTFLVPAMLNMVLADPAALRESFGSLRCVRLGGSAISPQRLRDAIDLFGPVVMQSYGQGETTSGVTVLTGDELLHGIASDPDILSSCGRAIFDAEVRIFDDQMRPLPAGQRGEIAVRGPDCVKEYWHEPELSACTFRNGWVLTGDIGYMRDDGYLFIVDRKKDMIVSGGFNIYSSEVENQLYAHPAVSEACVIGVPDEQWGETVKAIVVLKSGKTATQDELIEFCAGRLGRFKKPKSVDIVSNLPLNRSGKIDRHALKESYWNGAPRRVN